MSKGLRIGIVVGVFAVFVVSFLLLQSGNSRVQNQTSKGPSYVSSNWKDAYDLDSKDPLGLYYFNYFLKTQVNKNTPVAIMSTPAQFLSDSLPASTYCFMGKQFALTEAELNHLEQRINTGSVLLLAAESVDKNTLRRFFSKLVLSFHYQPVLRLTNKHKKQYQLVNTFQNDTIPARWRGFKSGEAYTKIEKITESGELTMMLETQVGKGKIIWCLHPDFFVNYQLLTSEGYRHGRNALVRIPKDHSVYWIEFANYEQPKELEEDFGDEEGERDHSYLQFILQNKSLTIAMLLSFVGLFLFILFRAKRMQPAVPYIGKKKNMTAEFANTLTSIYLSKREPMVLVKMAKRNFQQAVYNHFYLDISKDNYEKALQSLAEKSNTPLQELKELMAKFNPVHESAVDENYLIALNKQQKQFYQRTGIVAQRVLDTIQNRQFIFHRSVWIAGVFIFAGLSLLMYGSYLLIRADGIGILLWPIALVLLFFGVRWMSRPILHFSKKEIVYAPLFGKKKSGLWQELLEVQSTENRILLRFEAFEVIINHWEMVSTDMLQLRKFVEQKNEL